MHDILILHIPISLVSEKFCCFYNLLTSMSQVLGVNTMSLAYSLQLISSVYYKLLLGSKLHVAHIFGLKRQALNGFDISNMSRNQL